MKVVHSSKDNQEVDLSHSLAVLMQNGKQWEGENPVKAVELYKKMIRLFPHKTVLYDRLLIVYRKEKNIKAELKLLTSAITFFKKLHDQAHHRKASKKITQLSNAISSMTGMHTRGKPIDPILPQPLEKWTKRQAGLLKKLKKR